MTTQELLQAAQAARMPLALADTDTKNAALEAMAVALIAASDAILAAQPAGCRKRPGPVSDVMLDRLALTRSRPDRHGQGHAGGRGAAGPGGRCAAQDRAPNGLVIEKNRCADGGHCHHL